MFGPVEEIFRIAIGRTSLLTGASNSSGGVVAAITRLSIGGTAVAAAGSATLSSVVNKAMYDAVVKQSALLQGFLVRLEDVAVENEADQLLGGQFNGKMAAEKERGHYSGVAN